MTKYLSKRIVLAAYKKLSTMTADPELQGQTQRTTALRLVAALDAFKKEYSRSCDTSNKEDKKRFSSLVGDVVRIDAEDYTKNFFTGIESHNDNRHNDYGVGSNFFSVNVVSKSRVAKETVFDVPLQGDTFFYVKNGVLLTDKILYESLPSYLEDGYYCTAFIIWLTREIFSSEKESEKEFDALLRDSFQRKYSKDFADALWDRACFDDNLFGVAEDEYLSSEPLDIHKGDILGLFPSTKEAGCPDYENGNNLGEQVRTRMGLNIKRTNDEPRNLIFFGAPGTGKSYELNKLAVGEKGTDEVGFFSKENVRRITFYPDYTYSQFVGCFKPCTRYAEPDGDEPISTEKPYVSYEFVPGPFLDTYIKAVQNPNENHLLIVEEINRANPAAVFGDIFQLLDRDEDGRSEYQITVPREIEAYLKLRLPEYATTAHFPDAEELLQEQLRLKSEEVRLSIPPNMFIWATMNSADQGVFPMDTAFKRRWDFRYIGINDGEEVIAGKKVEIAGKENSRVVKWNDLRRSINDLLLDYAGVNEDKLLGPFFVKPEVLEHSDLFTAAFKDKVLLYLFEDAGKTKRKRIFADGNKTYSQVCETFEKCGTAVFAEGFKEIPNQGASSKQEDETPSDIDTEV